MATSLRLIIASIMLVFLVACGVSNATSEATYVTTVSSDLIPEFMETNPPPLYTTDSPSTSLPSTTPNFTHDASAQAVDETQSAERTLIPQFSRFCEENFMSLEISPNQLWLADQCFSENEQSPILTISNRQTQVLWKLILRDYMYVPAPDSLWYAGFSVIYWSGDGNYVYFASSTVIDGGECFMVSSLQHIGYGLFRLDLQSGGVVTILPLLDGSTNYIFSFSPLGNKLVYESHYLGVNILDVKSRKAIHVNSNMETVFERGGFLWSLDESEFIYSTAFYGDNGPINYSLRLVNTTSGSERLLLESSNDCFVARSWTEDRVITIERYGDDRNRTLLQYDLDSNIITESTATADP
ncbi:MAG: hypothetical protein U0X93_00135 [Anaerolineales bacterium]